MITGLINFTTLAFDKSINWLDVLMLIATSASAIGTIALAVFGYKALNPWKKELEYKHKAEFIAQAKFLLLCMDNFYGDGKIDDKIRNLTPIEKPYWKPFFENEVDRYTKEVNIIYKNLLTQEAYIDGLKIKVRRNIIREFLKIIALYKDKLSLIATAKLNFCHTENKTSQASFGIYEENSKKLVKIKKKAHKLYKKVKNI